MDQAGPEALWEDGRVWLESLAVNPLVCLFGNPCGSPVCRSQLVCRRLREVQAGFTGRCLHCS